VRRYYIVPEGKVGHDAFAVIREPIRAMDKVAIARVVLTNREHIRDSASISTAIRSGHRPSI
jgi:DNA end-binding protein Ku